MFRRLMYLKVTGLLVLLAAVASLAACVPAVLGSEISLSQAVSLSKAHNIKSVVFQPANGVMVLTSNVTGENYTLVDVTGTAIIVKDGTVLSAGIGNMSIADLEALGFVMPAEYSTYVPPAGSLSPWLIILPLLFMVVLFFFLMRGGSGQTRQAQGLERSRAKLVLPSRPSVTFADVAGIDEAKQELEEIVDFLKNRQKFAQVGARIPKGVLLIGPPGTGKTLLARAIAGEAAVPFFSISGSEFVEMFVGLGAARVRDLFDQAKRTAPCIVFIDEIDAVGRRRGGGLVTSNDEREQTLNQILTEMDGFNPNIGTIVLAATNRPDVLDPALLRPGRFDRRISLSLPDTNGRAAILKVHCANKPLDKSVNLDVIAKQTHGFSGADLANLVNEAAILTARRNKNIITMEEMEESIDRVISGPQRRSLQISPRERERTAFHEGGHALVARLLPNADPVHKISIIARASMGGYTRFLTEDRYLMTKPQLNDILATALAGHAAEELMFGEVSTGPHNDIRQATGMAKQMVTQYGMSEKLQLRTYGNPDEDGTAFYERKDYSEEVAKQIDIEIDRLIGNAREVARTKLRDNKARLIHLAKRLLTEETLEGQKLEDAFTEPLTDADQQAPAANGVASAKSS